MGLHLFTVFCGVDVGLFPYVVEFFEDFLGLFCGEECFGEYGVVVNGSFLVTLVCVGCAALPLPVANSASNAWCMNEIPDDY